MKTNTTIGAYLENEVLQISALTGFNNVFNIKININENSNGHLKDLIKYICKTYNSKIIIDNTNIQIILYFKKLELENLLEKRKSLGGYNKIGILPNKKLLDFYNKIKTFYKYDEDFKDSIIPALCYDSIEKSIFIMEQIELKSKQIEDLKLDIINLKLLI